MRTWRSALCRSSVLTILVVLNVARGIGQDVAAADTRLSDPEFIKIRDEAIAAEKCAEYLPARSISSPNGQKGPAADRKDVVGEATAEALVMTDGTVKYIRVVKADHPVLGENAIWFMGGSKYLPAVCSGKPVPSIVTTVTTKFVLQ